MWLIEKLGLPTWQWWVKGDGYTDLSQVSVWASSAIIDSRATGPHSKCALVFPVMSGRFPEKP